MCKFVVEIKSRLFFFYRFTLNEYATLKSGNKNIFVCACMCVGSDKQNLQRTDMRKLT